MQLTADRAELAAAATDLVLAVIALAGAIRVPRRDWRAVFLLMAAASLLGAGIHGLAGSGGAASPWWWPLDFALAGALAGFAAAAARDRLGASRARRAWPPLLALAAAAAAVSRAFPASFAPFLSFEAAVVIAAGASWLGLARSARSPGAAALAAGCGVALIAGVVGASGARVDPGWPLDANALFHLAQIPALLLWIRGARASAGAARP